MFERSAVAFRMLREELSATEFETLTGPVAASAVRLYADIAKIADAGLTLAAGRVEATDRAALAGTGVKDTKDLLSAAAGVSRGAAEAKLDLADRLSRHAATKAAFANGDLSGAEATEIAKAADRNADAESSLLDEAKKDDFTNLRNKAAAVNDTDPDADAKRAAAARASRNVRTWTDTDGLAHLKVSGPGDVVAAAFARINAAAQERFRVARGAGIMSDARHNLFDGFADLVLGAPMPPAPRGDVAPGQAPGPPTSAQPSGSSRPAKPMRPKVDLMILIDFAALRRGRAEVGERCEIPGLGPVAVETARAYLGDAALKFICTDGVSVAAVAHMGRHRGSYLRSALAAMFSSCLRCGRGLGIEWDHINPVAKGGPTSLTNLQPLCRSCHRAKTAADFPEGTSGYSRRRAAVAGSRAPKKAKTSPRAAPPGAPRAARTAGGRSKTVTGGSPSAASTYPRRT
jgi:hypothetical protein